MTTPEGAPRPPDELVDALQDSVHHDVGISRPAKSVKVKPSEGARAEALVSQWVAESVGHDLDGSRVVSNAALSELTQLIAAALSRAAQGAHAGCHVMACGCDVHGVGGAPRTQTDPACLELRAQGAQPVGG